MSLDVKLLGNNCQQEMVELFNCLIKESTPLSSVEKFKKLLANNFQDDDNIDDKHEINNNVRLRLEDQFERIPPNSIDASALLTGGPFQGKSLLWVACYIGASRYTFYDEKDKRIEGYSYILGQLIKKAIPSSVKYNTEFKINNRTLSTFWLVVYARLKSLKNQNMSILDNIINIITNEDLLNLDFNSLSTTDDNVALSPLGLMIETDLSMVRAKIAHQDYVCMLLELIPPKDNPGLFDLNKPVLDMSALGMTTLCLAAKGDSDLITFNQLSIDSPFISILRAADLKTLNFKAKILKGKDRGKTPLWYSACMLEDDEVCYEYIADNVDFDQLDFNDKAEDPKDKNANKSALWFVSHIDAKLKNSRQMEMLLKKVKDLSKLDYNNGPTSPKDKNIGKTVLWNLGEAALEGKIKPFISALKQGKQLNLDYGARAQQGNNTGKSVLSFALSLAMNNNFKALNLVLQNIKHFGLNPDAIQGFELEMLCHLAKKNYLYPLEVLLPYIKMKPEFLNRKVSIDNSKKNVVFLLIELAWNGYPHFLKLALKDISIESLIITLKADNPVNHRVIKEINKMISDVSRGYSEPSDMPILQGFLETGYEELSEQMQKLNFSSTTKADILDYQAISAPVTTLTTKFNLLQHSARQDAKKPKNVVNNTQKTIQMKKK